MLQRFVTWLSGWCSHLLSKGAQGTFHPDLFNRAQAYNKQNPKVLPWAIVALCAAPGIGITYSILVKPVVVKGCTWVLTSGEEEGFMRQNRRAAVEAESVQLGTMTRRIQTVGKLTANASVTLRAEIHGRIKKIAFTEGGQVKRNDLLVQFEDDDIQAEFKQAEAELALRKTDYARAQQLQQTRSGTVKDYDKAHAELAIAEGRLAAAKSKLAKSTIVAPFDGTIGLIQFSEGSYIQANQELVHLVDTTPMRVEFKVPEKFVNDIGPGQMAEVRVQPLGDRIFIASIDAIDSKIETENHSIGVKGSIPNENGILKAGSFAQISLIIGEKGDTIMVDESAVDREGNFEFVWVIEKGRAHRQRVITGVREKQKTEIVAGLKPGQIVVTAGQIRLADGMNVNITNMTAEAIAAADKKPGEPAKEEKPEEKKDEKKEDPKKETKETEVKPTPEAKPATEVKPEAPTTDTKPEEKKTDVAPQNPAEVQPKPQSSADQPALAQGN